MSEEFIKSTYEMCKAAISNFYILTEDEVSTEKDIAEICRNYFEVDNISDYYIRWDILNEKIDPIELLSQVDEKKFIVLINIHLRIIEQPDFIQTIKNRSEYFRNSHVKVFLVCNDKKIPVELNRDLTYIEYGLPDENSIAQSLRIIHESLEGSSVNLEYDSDEVIQSAKGLTSLQTEFALALSAVRTKSIDSKEVTRFKANEYLKSGMMELEEPKSIDSFQGYEHLKEYINEISSSFFNESKYNLPYPKGILLVGVPGTGKTLASRVIASALNLMLLKADLGKVFSEYVGSSERNMRLFINITERMAPIVLRIDEIEKQMSGFGNSGLGDNGVRNSTFAPFLSWMQDCTLPVYKIATANRVEMLPPELLRKGRFDEIFFLDLPNEVEVATILGYHINSRISFHEDFVQDLLHENDIADLVQYYKGYSGAEIEQCCIDALRKYENSGGVLKDRIVEIAKSTTPLSILRKEDIDIIRDWAVKSNAKMASSNKQLESEKRNIRRKIQV